MNGSKTRLFGKGRVCVPKDDANAGIHVARGVRLEKMLPMVGSYVIPIDRKGKSFGGRGGLVFCVRRFPF